MHIGIYPCLEYVDMFPSIPTTMPFLPELISHVLSLTQLSNTRASVHIFHPGCRKRLLSVPAIPQPPTARTNTLHHACADGVDHRLVMDACHIITNYAAKVSGCYLSTDIAGQNSVRPYCDSDGLQQLVPGKYYQPGPPSVRAIANYLVVTDFAAWKFPSKKDIPAHWRRPRGGEEMELRRKHAPCPPEEFEIEVAFDDRDRGGCVVTKQAAGECLQILIYFIFLCSSK